MNQIKVSIQQSIIGLTAHGWSRRRIARELHVDRATVGRHLRAVANAATNPTLGSESDPRQMQPVTRPTARRLGRPVFVCRLPPRSRPVCTLG
jgi:hypothetical protein